MKPKYIILFILSFGVVSFFACKKCQTCKVKDAVGNTIYYSQEQCEFSGGMESYKKELQGDWVCNKYTVNDSDGVTIYVSKQVCGWYETLAPIKDSLYQVFIADSPSVIVTPLTTRVECANHGE